jgi:zinc/manganese transport system substrate-binding protein
MNIVFNFRKQGSVRRKRIGIGAVLAAAALAVAGCSSSGAAGDGGVSVVASTNVWADVVEQVAGSLSGRTVHVTSFIDDPAADPHSYEANVRNQLTIKRADLVIENGGGYDDFMTTMRKASGTKATVLDAVQLAGVKKIDGELNEHVWYDFPSVRKIADRIADVLAGKDAADAKTFHANARRFGDRLEQLMAAEESIKAAHAGTGVAITEPVPLYLLQACGLVNRTPAAFSEAVEEGNDVSARVLQQTTDLFSRHQVALLAYNAQTSGAETTAVRAVAETNHVPVVPVTETLPPGENYLSWMSGNVAAVQQALAKE